MKPPKTTKAWSHLKLYMAASDLKMAQRHLQVSMDLCHQLGNAQMQVVLSGPCFPSEIASESTQPTLK